VAEGDLRNGVLLDLLPPEETIDAGTLVLTSGLGGNYPPGILIGTVDEVEQRPQSAFKRATLTPSAQLDELDTVLVLINFIPERLTAP
jgi:rod shape-determining protein MreC